MINKQLKLLLIFLVSAGVIAISSGLIIMVFNGFNSKNSSQKYETTFFLKNAENQYALFNEDGERLTDFIYTSHSDFINGTAEVTLDDEVGIINSKGKMTVDFGTYESITSKNGVYEARDKNSKSYIINGKGKVLYNLEDAVLHTYINSDYYSVLEDRKAKKYYALGSNGEELDSFDITSNEDITTNTEDYFVSMFYNGKNYIFDLTTGKEIISFDDSVHYCINRVSDDRKTIILNSCASSNNSKSIYKILVNNKIIDISNECDNAFFKDGQIICTKDYNEYLLDSNYKRSISIAYVSYEDDKNYAKAIYSGDTKVEFYNNGNLAKTVTCRTLTPSYINNGLYLLDTYSSTDCGTKSGIYEFYNSKGEKVFDKSFVRAENYDYNGNAKVSEDNINYYLIDSKGKQISKLYNDINTVAILHGYYVVTKDNLKGLINSKGEEVIPAVYKDVSTDSVHDVKYATMTTDDATKVIYNLNNNKEITSVTGNVSLNEHYILVSNNGKNQYYSYKNGNMFHEL